jgi:hypothetical protein
MAQRYTVFLINNRKSYFIVIFEIGLLYKSGCKNKMTFSWIVYAKYIDLQTYLK